eukprot:COSAG06_NODE_38271_length_425_cov_0.950920_1_plen_44_part_10
MPACGGARAPRLLASPNTAPKGRRAQQSQVVFGGQQKQQEAAGG